MNLIEIETKMGKDGMIQVPKDELRVTGLTEGDDICLLYVTHSDGSRGNSTGEFVLEKSEQKFLRIRKRYLFLEQISGAFLF